MIINAILYALYGIIQLIISPILLFDDVTLPEGIDTALTTAGSYIAPLNGIMPIDTVTAILVVFVYIEGAILLYKLIMWGIKKIPTIN